MSLGTESQWCSIQQTLGFFPTWCEQNAALTPCFFVLLHCTHSGWLAVIFRPCCLTLQSSRQSSTLLKPEALQSHRSHNAMQSFHDCSQPHNTITSYKTIGFIIGIDCGSGIDHNFNEVACSLLRSITPLVHQKLLQRWLPSVIQWNWIPALYYLINLPPSQETTAMIIPLMIHPSHRWSCLLPSNHSVRAIVIPYPWV